MLIWMWSLRHTNINMLQKWKAAVCMAEAPQTVWEMPWQLFSSWWKPAIPFQLVPPKKWKKEYSLGNDKNQSIAVCKKLFPNVDLLPTARCTKDSDGMAEALLLALYAQRHF